MPDKKLLLHTCCAPCLTQCLEVLQGRAPWEKILPYQPDFKISVYYYNPNIHPETEYFRRLEEVQKLAKEAGNLDVLTGKYTPEEWIEQTRGLEDSPEKGPRCKLCYNLRLDETFRVARELGFDTVATTLTLSPLKNTAAVNQSGMTLSTKYNLEYLTSDFKKREGFKKSLELSQRYNLYRQNYCGCIYSLTNTKNR